MSCGPVETTFRLLDHLSWWGRDFAVADQVTIGETLELALIDDGVEDEAQVLARLAPPLLARGCGPCEWYLVAAADCAGGARLLRRGPCGPAWTAIAGVSCRVPLIRPVAIAAAPGRVAVLDAGSGELFVLTAGGEQVLARILTRSQGPIALGQRGQVYLVDADGRVAEHDPVGAPVRVIAGPVGVDRIERLAAGKGGELWAAAYDESAPGYRIWRLPVGETAFRPATAAELAAALPETGIVAATAAGFCLREPRRELCFDWCGGTPSGPIDRPLARRRHREGSATTVAIDSGVPRCRWHRVHIDGDVPEKAGLEVSVATHDVEGESPHENDWQEVTGSPVDFLIDQPPGRWLRLRLRLRGEGRVTPSIRRIRLDLPRSTSAEWLPGVYRETPATRDFLERFVSLFDATLEGMDHSILCFPAALDPGAAREETLPWLASLLGVALDPSWPPDRRRALLREIPELYRRRGTPEGLRRLIEVVSGVSPSIEELAATQPYAALGKGAQVNGTRLFGRSGARFRVGASPLGGAPIKSYGNPDLDAIGTRAHRIRVQVPPLSGFDTPLGRARLARLVDAGKPAHVTAEVRVGDAGLLVGLSSAVGIDTGLLGLPRPILGRDGNVRLTRASILARGAARRGVLAVGISAAVGTQTDLL